MNAYGPPQLGVLSFQGSKAPPQSPSPSSDPRSQFPVERDAHNVEPASASSGTESTPPKKDVFGTTLADLFARDGVAVPMVVYQCIQAVDLFGLGVEGIYRQSGSVNHVNQLKQMFDKGTFILPLISECHQPTDCSSKSKWMTWGTNICYAR